MRFSNSLGGAGFAASGLATRLAFTAFFGLGLGLADLRGAAFALDGLGAAFLMAFLTGFFTGFLAAFRGFSPAIRANLAWACHRPKPEGLRRSKPEGLHRSKG